MFIDKYYKYGGYYDEKGCYYEDAKSFICSGILKFCGCGDPDSAAKYIKKALTIVNDLKTKVWENKITYDEWAKTRDDFFISCGAEYFMWYFLDNLNLIEHGSSVPGWLTKNGEELLSDLNELYNTETKE